MTVRVTGAGTYQQAHAVARHVTRYNLVKSCIWGEDFNWGRIAAAVGAAGVPLDPAKVTIRLMGITCFRDGEPVEYDLDQARATMKSDQVLIEVDLGAGDECATCWTCDLTPQYVELNAT